MQISNSFTCYHINTIDKHEHNVNKMSVKNRWRFASTNVDVDADATSVDIFDWSLGAQSHGSEDIISMFVHKVAGALLILRLGRCLLASFHNKTKTGGKAPPHWSLVDRRDIYKQRLECVHKYLRQKIVLLITSVATTKDCVECF